MAHQVSVNLSSSFVLNKDVTLEVKRHGRKLGTVLVSRGNIEWVPAGNSVNRKRLSWRRFAELMEENGRDVRAKSAKQ